MFVIELIRTSQELMAGRLRKANLIMLKEMDHLQQSKAPIQNLSQPSSAYSLSEKKLNPSKVSTTSHSPSLHKAYFNPRISHPPDYTQSSFKMATLTFLYPNEPNAQYDLEYYKTSHMPLMEKHWTKYGLKRWSVSKFRPNADGSPLPYVFYGVIELESPEALNAALADASGEEMANDVKNYSNIRPIVLVGELVHDVQV